MDNTQNLIVYLQKFKTQLTVLKNMTNDGVPQVESYSINSKTSYLKDKIDGLDDYLNDILIDLM